MTKILLISDSHYFNDILKMVIKQNNNCDRFIHCGDSSLEKNDELLNNFIVVKGNHDDYFDDYRFIRINDYRIFITHGHLYNIYETYDLLLEKAKLLKCNVIFHGHTHVPTFQIIDGITIINPGSLMINRGSYGFGTFAIVTLNECISVKFYHHETFEDVSELVLVESKSMLETFKTPHK